MGKYSVGAHLRNVLAGGIMLLSAVPAIGRSVSGLLYGRDTVPAVSGICDSAQAGTERAEKGGEVVKTGYSFGPLPIVAYDADREFQFGGMLNIYNFGDGTNYPNPNSTWYIEVSAYTTGNQKYVVSYDDKTLIPGVRMAAAVRYLNDAALEFFGFNGYQSIYREDMPSGFYRYSRNMFHFKADFQGEIVKNFYWEAGYHFNYIRTSGFTTDKYELENTLFDLYSDWGIIPEDMKSGGISSALRVGLMYDSRDAESIPSRGIWAEAHYIFAPRFLGSSVFSNKLNVTFRQYVPLWKDRLVFAYRLNYQGFFGDAPWYLMPFYTVVGPNYDYDGIGGFRTARGIMLNRVQGPQSGFFNVELRWRFVDFVLWKQNIGFALSAFCDGAAVLGNYALVNRTGLYSEEFSRFTDLSRRDRLHCAAGAGVRFIMNGNFIVAAEYAHSFNPQDGGGAFYLNTGFLF